MTKFKTISDLNRRTLFEDEPKEPTMASYDAPGLDDPVLAQTDNSSLNVCAMTPQDLTGCPIVAASNYKGIYGYHESWSKLFKDFSDSISTSFETSTKGSYAQVTVS